LTETKEKKRPATHARHRDQEKGQKTSKEKNAQSLEDACVKEGTGRGRLVNAVVGKKGGGGSQGTREGAESKGTTNGQFDGKGFRTIKSIQKKNPRGGGTPGANTVKSRKRGV